MKKLLFLLLVAGSVSAAGRGDLLERFRGRTGEPDSASSFYTDSTAIDWLNSAIRKVARLSNSYHTEDSFGYTSAVNVFEIPATREVRAILAKVGNRWYDITGDQEALSFSVTRVDSLISRVYLQVNGFVPRETTISYNADSIQYSLPSDFRRVLGVMARYGYVSTDSTDRYWRPMIQSPGTLLDTNVGQYYIYWEDADSPFLRTLGLLTYVEQKGLYSSVDNMFPLDKEPEAIKSISVKIAKKWYDLTDQKEILRYTLTQYNADTSSGARLYVDIGGVLPKTTSISYSQDSALYHLPADFRGVLKITARSSGEWNPIIPNPGFVVDTNVSQYYVTWDYPDSAILTIKTDDLSGGDTLLVEYMSGPVHGDSIMFSYYIRTDNLYTAAPISVSYLAGPVTGDSLRISYYAQPPLMTATDSTCVLDDDLEGMVLEEAMGYYYKAIREDQGASQMWQQVRQDLQ